MCIEDNGHTMYTPKFYNIHRSFLSKHSWFAKIFLQFETRNKYRILFIIHSRHEGSEFGYKSWKFRILPILSAMQYNTSNTMQILPILSAMQGSASERWPQYKCKYNKDVGTLSFLVFSDLKIFTFFCFLILQGRDTDKDKNFPGSRLFLAKTLKGENWEYTLKTPNAMTQSWWLAPGWVWVLESEFIIDRMRK